MVEQLKIYENPVLALEIIDGFTETDFELVQKWADAKHEKGFSKINLLLKLDELKISESSLKAFFGQTIKLMKNFKQLGHISIVGQSNFLKKVVSVDNFFFQKFSKGSEERYFDVPEIEEAFAFVESDM